MTPDALTKLTPLAQEEWRREIDGKFGPDEMAGLGPAQIANLRLDHHSGTGFVVFVPDERLGKNGGFPYFVTNRHVVEPGIEVGRPCKPLRYHFFANRVADSTNPEVHIEQIDVAPTVKWYHSNDDSIDLAITTVNFNQADYDLMTIPITMFTSGEMIAEHNIVEGDPVTFTGLFIQYAGSKRLEPIVRSGSIAMLPTEPIQTTLGKPGHIYFAEAHAFGGNS